jgi:methylmalonyl-CoA/ethylmalonyl-CoA epimerase
MVTILNLKKKYLFMLPELSDCILDHVAVATNSLDKTIALYTSLGLSFSPEREVVQDQGVTTAFAAIDTHAHLELLEPYGDDGPIHRYLAKKGEGLHHLCFRVPDVLMKTKELKEAGLILLNEEPVKGANNCLVNFIHPKSTGGVLIEISQKLESNS